MTPLQKVFSHSPVTQPVCQPLNKNRIVMRQLWDLLRQLQNERALVCFHFKIALLENLDLCVSPSAGVWHYWCTVVLKMPVSCLWCKTALTVFWCFQWIMCIPNLSTPQITKHNKTQLWKTGLWGVSWHVSKSTTSYVMFMSSALVPPTSARLRAEPCRRNPPLSHPPSAVACWLPSLSQSLSYSSSLFNSNGIITLLYRVTILILILILLILFKNLFCELKMSSTKSLKFRKTTSTMLSQIDEAAVHAMLFSFNDAPKQAW